MQKKLTITLDDQVYEGLHKVIGRRKISGFIESLVRPYVVQKDLEREYRRMAQEEAIAKRMQNVDTLQQPGTILTQWTKAGIGLQTERTVPLPNGIQFSNEPGIPNGTRTPDGFGTAVFAVDFDLARGGGGNVIYFQPDGTAIDAAGNPNNGVVYIAKPGQTPSSRAITLFGATGRLKSWSLTGQGANLKWQ